MHMFAIRTITAFVHLDQVVTRADGARFKRKLLKAIATLRALETKMTQEGYVVQTVRIATNPFYQWLPLDHDQSNKSDVLGGDQSLIDSALFDHEMECNDPVIDLHWDLSTCLRFVDKILEDHGICFMSLGSATKEKHVREVIPQIIQASPRFSASVTMEGYEDNLGDCVQLAKTCAECCQTISSMTEPAYLKNGLGNFRFGVAMCCNKPDSPIPFFPVASRSSSTEEQQNEDTINFAIGLENGCFARSLLQQSQSITNINQIFKQRMQNALQPIQQLCVAYEQEVNQQNQNKPSKDFLGVKYAGIDTSLNPSLEPEGSVAGAIEVLEEVSQFGGAGSLAAANAITQALQSMPGIKRTGYCGLMLPLCEDARLAELASIYPKPFLSISTLLSISAVCGVGIDTVPLPGNVSIKELQALYLDVAAIAHRYNKSLSCRVFPLAGKQAGEWTPFEDSPHMMNSRILSLTSDYSYEETADKYILSEEKKRRLT